MCNRIIKTAKLNKYLNTAGHNKTVEIIDLREKQVISQNMRLCKGFVREFTCVSSFPRESWRFITLGSSCRWKDPRQWLWSQQRRPVAGGSVCECAPGHGHYSDPRRTTCNGGNALSNEVEVASEQRLFLSVLSSIVALVSLVREWITLGLRRFIALHSDCTNAPDSETDFMAALLRERGGCPVIRDGIPARSKGCARRSKAGLCRREATINFSLSLPAFMALLTVIYERHCAAPGAHKQSDNNSKYGDARLGGCCGRRDDFNPIHERHK